MIIRAFEPLKKMRGEIKESKISKLDIKKGDGHETLVPRRTRRRRRRRRRRMMMTCW